MARKLVERRLTMHNGYTMTDVQNYIAQAEKKVGKMIGREVKLEVQFKPEKAQIHDDRKSTIEDKVNEIIDLVGNILDENVDEIKSLSRKRELAECRYIAIKLIHEYYYPHLSFKAIGRFFKNRDHSTIMTALDTFSDLYDTDKTFKGKYANCSDEYKKLLNKQQTSNDESIQETATDTQP
jgi:chromosomal replication initiation ATPase DnaA